MASIPHLRNIALVDGDVTPFDRLEFNESMRWIDVMNDVACTDAFEAVTGPGDELVSSGGLPD